MGCDAHLGMVFFVCRSLSELITALRFKVWAWIRPQLKSGKMAEEMKKAKAKIAEIEKALGEDTNKTKELEDANAKIKAETDEMSARLASGSSGKQYFI